MTRTFGLRSALILLVLIAIAPVFAVVVQASLSEQRSRLERAEASLKSLVALSAAHQEQFIEGARQMLTAIANVPPVYENDPHACARYLSKLQDKYPLYANFGVFDPRGRLTCRGSRGNSAVVIQDRPYFTQALQARHFTVGDYIVGRVSGKPALPFSMPLYSDAGDQRGVVVASLDLQSADAQLQELTVPPDFTLFVTDANAVVLASAGPASLPVGTPLRPRFLSEAIAAGRAGPGHRAATDGQDWLYTVRPVGRQEEGRLFVIGMVSGADVIAPAARQLYLQLGALGLIALLGAMAAWAFGDRILARPLARLLGRVDALEREELPLDEAPPGSALRELTELDRRFHAMARALAQRSVQRDGALAEMEGQNRLLASVLQSMAEGLLVIDRRGRLLHINASARHIMPGVEQLARDRDPLSLTGEAWGVYEVDGVTPLALAGRPAARALQGETVERYRHVLRGTLAGGVEKIIEGSARPLAGPDGRTSGAVMVFFDITAAFRAERALIDSERRYRKLFESNPHPMWVYDVQTLRFLTVNDAAMEHYGYSHAEFLAMTLADIRAAEDVPRLMQTLQTLGSATTSHSEHRHRIKSGRSIQVEISAHALDHGGRAARIVLAHDITQRLEAQQALQQLNESLEARVSERTREWQVSNQELESFSYSVSHDLRAPLQVIDGFSRALAERHAHRLDGQALHYLDRIRENTQQMSALIDDLLSLAKVTRARLRSEQINLASKAHQVVERLRARFPGREVAVQIDEDMTCCGDPGLLAVVLENLIENAWKFTGRTHPAQVRIGRKTGEQGEAVFYVEDNGAGFDMAYVDKLFNAFQRLHAPSDFGGTGIGLATVQRIITRHGGRVWAEASPGRGATFQFTLQRT